MLDLFIKKSALEISSASYSMNTNAKLLGGSIIPRIRSAKGRYEAVWRVKEVDAEEGVTAGSRLEIRQNMTTPTMEHCTLMSRSRVDLTTLGISRYPASCVGEMRVISQSVPARH